MTRLLRGFPALLTSLLVCLCLVSPAGSGSMGLLGVGGPSAVAPTYQGPGDVVSGATAWYGLRAYSAAKAGTKAINLCDNTGANCADISTDATTGKLNAPGTLGSNNCNTSGTCLIKIWYDQSAGVSCAGALPCDASQSTTAQMPTLLFSCINSLPCAVFASASNQWLLSPAGFSAFASGTMSIVSTRTGNFTTQGVIISIDGASNGATQYRALANSVQMFLGTVSQFISNITDNNYHALQTVYNGASSVLFCGGSAGTACSTGGTSNSISPGTTTTGSGRACIGATSNGATCTGTPLEGQIIEVGVWESAIFNGTQQTNMNANQYTFWGPF